MLFETYGARKNPAVLFFNAMGVTGASSSPVAEHLQDQYFCIPPTSTVYCPGQRYRGKADEVRQVEDFLRAQGVERLALVVDSSIGADLALAFVTQTKLEVGHVFFAGGQFARIGRATRRIMTPFLYLAIRSRYWSNGLTLKKILWCDDEAIRPYSIAAGRQLRCGNLRRQMADSLEDKPFPPLPPEVERHTYVSSAALRNIIINTALRSWRPIRMPASRPLTGLTICSTRSAIRRASRSCCAASWSRTDCRFYR